MCAAGRLPTREYRGPAAVAEPSRAEPSRYLKSEPTRADEWRQLLSCLAAAAQKPPPPIVRLVDGRSAPDPAASSRARCSFIAGARAGLTSPAPKRVSGTRTLIGARPVTRWRHNGDRLLFVAGVGVAAVPAATARIIIDARGTGSQSGIELRLSQSESRGSSSLRA